MRSKLTRWLIVAVIAIAVVILMSSCEKIEKIEKKNGEEKVKSMFIELESTYRWKVVYHRDTGVMYAVSYGGSNVGNFTMLVNADGTPMVYKGSDTDP